MGNTETAYKNGIYKSDSAVYFIKDGKIIMKLSGSYYKTTANFMQGTFIKDLPQGIEETFEEAYAECKSW